MASVTAQRRLIRINDGSRQVAFDALAIEEPLEIRVAGQPIAVIMRTPGNDFELVAGFLISEGLVAEPGQIRTMRYCVREDEGAQEFNVVTADLVGVGEVVPRALATTSSCGLCGKTRIDQVKVRATFDVCGDPMSISTQLLAEFPGQLRRAQQGFDDSGGLHAAALFTGAGELVCVREDIGRHNAFDKVIGWAALAGRLPLTGHAILASGRASFELAQKALMAGIPLLAAISAPSELAVSLAEESGMTIVGFLRGSTMNVYSAAQRVV